MTEEKRTPPARGEDKKETPPSPGPKLAPSEQPIMTDGQLGSANLERGPERRNPEGTADTPNPRPEDR